MINAEEANMICVGKVIRPLLLLRYISYRIARRASRGYSHFELRCLLPCFWFRSRSRKLNTLHYIQRQLRNLGYNTCLCEESLSLYIGW